MNLEIRPLGRDDLPAADRIFRTAFGTFLGVPEPASFGGDADFVSTRWHADPSTAIGAFHGVELVGSNFLSIWGSFGFFGPLTVRPDLWDRGIARALLVATLPLFDARGVRHRALFTFPQSPKHLALYQKFGFWPQHLTSVMSKAIAPAADCNGWSTFTDTPQLQRARMLEDCRELTDAIYGGLDLTREITAIETQGLGETVVLHDGSRLAAFATCHIGAGSEAGSGTAYLKFAAASPGDGAGLRLGRLLSSCEALARTRGLRQVVAGVNTARHGAYRLLLERGYRPVMQGVAMQANNEVGYNHAANFVLDDWR